LTLIVCPLIRIQQGLRFGQPSLLSTGSEIALQALGGDLAKSAQREFSPLRLWQPI
jgi:hypothetical protein